MLRIHYSHEDLKAYFRQKHKRVHCEFSHVWIVPNDIITVGNDSTPIPAHIFLAHEIAHWKLGHHIWHEGQRFITTQKKERDAWKLASVYLKTSGEWESAKRVASLCLASYYYEESDSPCIWGKNSYNAEVAIKIATTFINRL